MPSPVVLAWRGGADLVMSEEGGIPSGVRLPLRVYPLVPAAGLRRVIQAAKGIMTSGRNLPRLSWSVPEGEVSITTDFSP